MAARRETAEAGLRALRDGGNAVDAAVSMGFTAAVVEPTEASIGGSGFLLAHDPASDNAWSVEFPPRAPLRATADMYEPADGAGAPRLLGTSPVRDDANAIGPRAPCVPGAVAGLCLAHARFGTLPLQRLLEPAIELAEDGFEIDAYFTLQALANLEALRASPSAREIFLRDGLPPVAPFAAQQEGSPERLRQPDLARTLRAIAAGGAEAFYRGEVSRAIHVAFERCGGLMSQADLDAYRATIERPLRASYRGWSLLGPRAPSGGWTALQALQILDQADARPGLHVLAEALQLAFADRYRHAGDGADLDELLLSRSRAAELARMIRGDRKSELTASVPASPWRGHGTTHFCAVDAAGRIVSCTLTAGDTFGSKVVAEGVLFDSGMAWFEPRPGRPNSIAPAKRPLVNMAPLLLLDGTARVALGAAGGRRIISAVTQVASRIIDEGLAIQEAISAPRLDASDRAIRLSERFPRGVAEDLRALGHEVLVVGERHRPFAYDFARPAGAGVDRRGVRSGGIHPFAPGFVAAG